MTISAVEFWQRITSSSLATSDQCRSWVASAAQSLGTESATNVERIAEFLAAKGFLTTYQAQQLLQPQDPLVVVGNFKLLSPVEDPIWANWFLASHQRDGRPHWVYSIPIADLEREEVKRVGPSLQWMKRQAAVSGDGLQEFSEPQLAQDRIVVTAAPLSPRVPWQPPATWQAVLIQTQSLLQSLGQIHQAGLVHGQIRTDRIWIDDQRRVKLLRDPMVPPLPPGIASWGTLKSDLPARIGPLHFAAPEFSVPGQSPSVQTDLYALGVIWYWLATGKIPFADMPEKQLLAAHATQRIEAPKDLGPSSIQRCWQHCLAKNPAARFSTIAQLITALQKAVELDRRAPSAPPIPSAPSAIAPSAKKEAGAKPSQSVIKATAAVEPRPTSQPAEVKDAIAKSEVTEGSVNKNAGEKSVEKATSPTAAATAPPKQAVAPVTSPAQVESSAKTEPKAPPEKQVASPVNAPAKNPSRSNKERATNRDSQDAVGTDKPISGKPSPGKPSTDKPVPTKQVETKPAPAVPAPVAPVSAKLQETPKPIASKPIAEARPSPTEAKLKTEQERKAAPAEIKKVDKPADEAAPTSPKEIAPKPSQESPKTNEPALIPTPQSGDVSVAKSASSDEKTVVEAAKESAPQAPAISIAATKETKPEAKLSVDKKVDVGSAVAAAKAKPKATAVNKAKPVASGKRRKAAKRPVWFLPSLIAGSMLIFGVLITVLMNSNRPAEVAENKPTPSAESTESNANVNSENTVVKPEARDPVAERFQLVEGDGQLPWAPPNASGPVSLALLPPESQVLIFFQPSRWLSDAKHKELMSLLDADLKPVWQFLQSQTGLPPAQLKQVVVAAYPGSDGWPQYAVRVDLLEPKSLLDLKQNWGAVTEESVGSVKLLSKAAEGVSFYVPDQPFVDAQSVSSFCVGPTERMKQAAELQGGTAPLRRQMEILWKSSSSEADLTLIFAPNFLYAEGRQILANSVPRIRESLQQLLSISMQAGMITTTLDKQWYGELKLIGDSERDAPRIVNDLTERFKKLPDATEAWLVQENVHPYWKGLAIRFPQMLRAFQQQLRIGVEEGQAVANFYLPENAASNLLVSSWYAINTQPGSSPVATNRPDKPSAASPLTIDQMLDRPVTVAFDQESLEIALQNIAEASAESLPEGSPALRMDLDYTNLQKEGITQNQQIRQFSHRNEPLRVALNDLVKRGNPVVGVTDMKAADQKLIWIITDDPKNAGKKMVRVTTRKAAEEKKLPLPKEFAN